MKNPVTPPFTSSPKTPCATPALNLMIVAGEPSGDLLGSEMLSALKTRLPQLQVRGVGGERMTAVGGFHSLVPFQDLTTMGLEIFTRLPRLLGHLKTVRRAVISPAPHLLVTIDAPEFSFRVAKFAHLHNVPTLHCVAPSVWAWRPGRAQKIARFLDCLLTLFPFEPPLFEKEGLKSHFVGHPLAHKPPGNATLFWQRFPHLYPESPTLILLPGSRQGEIERLLPIFLKTAQVLSGHITPLQVVIPTLGPLVRSIEAQVSQFPEIMCTIVDDLGLHPHAFAAGTAALAASGTVTLELALAGLPHVVAYKTSPLTAALAKRLLRTPWVGLPNILCQRSVVPECLQNACTPETLMGHLSPLLSAAPAHTHQKEAFFKIQTMLKTALPFGEAAARIIESHLMTSPLILPSLHTQSTLTQP